jgi:hypothetical protein
MSKSAKKSFIALAQDTIHPRKKLFRQNLHDFRFCRAKKIFLVPNLLFIGSQEAVKKIWAKNRICHVKKVVEREK